MKKQDCELGMFVAVMQNINPLARNRLKVKRIGKVIGIYDDFANLMLFDSNITSINEIEDGTPIIIHRKLYAESFEFAKMKLIPREMIREGKIYKEG